MSKNILVLAVVIAMGGFFGCGGEDGPSQSATVTGTVANTSLSPLSGASVTVAGGVPSTTGSDGSYTLERVTSGVQNIAVSAPGYVSVSKSIDVAPMVTTYVPKIVLEDRDSRSTEIGSGGGEAASSDGNITLSIPAGALTSTVSVVVTNCDLLSVPYPVPSGYKLVYLAHLSPADTVLLTAATLYIPKPSESPVYFYRFDTASSVWELLGTGISDSLKTSISLTKFGWIAAVVPLASPGSITGKVVSSAGGGVAGADVRTGSHITVTDASGNYTLSNLAEGDVSVTASRTGYSDGSVSVTVVAGTAVTAGNITLSPASTYGSVSGKVLASVGDALIVGARVVAEGKTSYSDSNGNYSISGLTPGTVTVSVYAYEYLNKSESVTITAGGTASKDFRLAAVTVTDFSDDFETDKGWTATGLWNRKNSPQTVLNTLVDGGYVVLPDTGYLPSANRGTHVFWYGSSDTGSYIGTQWPLDSPGSGGRSDFLAILKGDLISPTISLSGYSIATLNFWTWWEIESRWISSTDLDSYDNMEIYVYDIAAGTWIKLARLNPDHVSLIEDIPYSSGGFNKSGKWVKHQYDLTSYVGKNIKLKFAFDAFDLGSNGFRGWLIDDVSISENPISPVWGR